MVRRRTTKRKKRAAYQALAAAPARHNGGWVILVLGGLVLVNLYVFVWDKKLGIGRVREIANEKTTAPAMTLPALPLRPEAPVAERMTTATVAAPIGPPGAIEGKVGKSDTLGRLLKRNGLSAAETDEVIRALSPVLDFRTLRTGETFRIERGADGHVKVFELEISKTHHVRAERQPTGELLGKT
ncbi:MAG: Opacity-associated protein LysM-like domain [Myxococcales bacterium]|nr:Opacity-associated protein LysM-like domain [Myxococcales bacterium]